MPQVILDYTLMVMEREQPSQAHASRMFLLLAQLAGFRAEIEAGSVTDTGEILATTNRIDSQMRRWKDTLPRRLEL